MDVDSSGLHYCHIRHTQLHFGHILQEKNTARVVLLKDKSYMINDHKLRYRTVTAVAGRWQPA